MEILNSLSKTTTKQQKRVGRGIGSGVGGHTTGKGAKGDKVRGKTKMTFDGTKIKKSWIKRTPFLRGKYLTLKRSFFRPINLSLVDSLFKENTIVTPKSFDQPVKILGNGQLTKVLTFKDLKISGSAAKKILASGGKIES